MLSQGFNSYDGAINVPNTLGNNNELTDSSAAAAIMIEKAAAQLVDLMVAGTNSNSLSNGPGIGTISKIGLDPALLTPLQRLVLEEVGKILGASARRTFSNVKENSGRLPTGRTLLGTIIDPLGIFSTSSLVEVDESDERILEAAGKLTEILRNANGGNNLAGNANMLQNITPADARKLAASVSNRLWEKRSELTVLTGHLAYVMLRQTARRLEKPKVVKKKIVSDSGVVTTVDVIQSNVGSDTEFSDSFARPPTPYVSVGISMSESDRLSRARSMLLQSKQSGLTDV